MHDRLIGSLSQIKSYVVVLSFYIKMMKQRTFQACSWKHSIKKGNISYFHQFSSILLIFWHYLVTKTLMTSAYKVILILDKFFLKYEVEVKLTPTPPGKTTLKIPSFITVKKQQNRILFCERNIAIFLKNSSILLEFSYVGESFAGF